MRLSAFSADLGESIRMAVGIVRASKMRSFLTTLGIVIGIVAVTLMATAIEGLNRAFSRSISALGSDVLYIQKYPWFAREDLSKYRNRKDITLGQALAVERLSTLATAVAPTVWARRLVKYEEKSIEDAGIIGTTEQYSETSNMLPEYGRFLTATDVRASRNVAVIGSEIAKRLFENVDPIGRSLKIGGSRFRVVGVLEARGSFLGMFNLDNRAVIPLSAFRKIFGHHRDVDIEVKVLEPSLMEEARDELTGIMRRVRRVAPGEPDDFAINEQSIFRSVYDNLTRAIYGTGIVITFLALVVGGIGVMNIMLVSVTERTREIGIRKALGATRRHILVQFLIESVFICMIGGVIGLFIAFILSKIIAKALLPTAMPYSWAFFAILIVTGVGIFFGLFPAAKAARLDPVEALRYE